jgi:chemotaxis protein methyltransferase CheR
MTDDECVDFLRWSLPRLGLQWAGYRKVRRQVCRRVRRRIADLGLRDVAAYRTFLERHPEEWARLDRLTHITISRFYRDREIFDGLVSDVLPALAADAVAHGRPLLWLWSAGAAGGEEPYTIALAWNLELAERFTALRLSVLATDVDDAMLERARTACYSPGSLKDLPARWRREGFQRRDGELCVREAHRRLVTVHRHDIRSPPPGGDFDLILCRSVAFTYFDPGARAQVAASLMAALRPGGALVLGAHEVLPPGTHGLQPWPGRRCTYRRAPREAMMGR